MLHNVVLLYRRTISFSYIVSTNQSRLHIPNVWSRGLLETRLSWKPETPITILELRAKTVGVDDTRELEPAEEYGGCRSWVDLPFGIPRANAVPALSDDEFSRRQGELRAALNASGIVLEEIQLPS